MQSFNETQQDGTATQRTFIHIPSSIEAEEAEEIGVEHLLRDIKSLSNGSGSSLASRVSAQLTSLQGLSSRLNEIKEYLTAVLEGPSGSNGGLPVNHQILYYLQDIFNLLPNLEATESAGVDHGRSLGIEGSGSAKGKKRPFTVATNDQLLVVYLSSLIRAVIALHDLVRCIISYLHLVELCHSLALLVAAFTESGTDYFSNSHRSSTNNPPLSSTVLLSPMVPQKKRPPIN